MEDRIEVSAMALSRSGNIIVTAKDGCTADDLIECDASDFAIGAILSQV